MNKNYRLQSAIDSSLGSSSYDLELNFNYTTTIQTFDSKVDKINVLQSKDILIPLNILTNNSSMQAITVYLKDTLGLKFAQISSLINRDQRTVALTYSNAKKKTRNSSSTFSLNKSGENSIDRSSIFIPVSILSSRRLSVLESIVMFLKQDQNLSFNQISTLLGKNYRTIWTVYRRGILKVKKINE